LNVLWKLSKWF